MTHMRLPLSATLLTCFLLCLTLGGCKLIFEPAPDAAQRLMRALAARDFRVMEEMVEDETLRQNFRALGTAFASEHYRGFTDYWEISEDVEVDETTKLSYVEVVVYVPQRGNADPKSWTLYFEMERSYLRWSIYHVEGLDHLLRDIARARGM